MSDFTLCLKCSPGHRRVLKSACPHRTSSVRRTQRLPDVSDAPDFVLPKDSHRLVIVDHGRLGRSALPLGEFLAGRRVSGSIEEIHFACRGTERGDIQFHGRGVDIDILVGRLMSLDLTNLTSITLSVPHSGSAPRDMEPLRGITLAQAIHVAVVTGLSRPIRVMGMKGSIVNGRWASYLYASDLQDMDEWGEQRWRGVESCKMISTQPMQDIHMMFQILD